jgi:hypothetical protein
MTVVLVIELYDSKYVQLEGKFYESCSELPVHIHTYITFHELKVGQKLL